MPTKQLKETIEAINNIIPETECLFLIAIDPSVIKTGYAVFNLTWTGVLEEIIESGTYEDSTENIVKQITMLFKKYNDIGTIVTIIEKPMKYGGRGNVAHSSGRIGKLYRIAGIFYGIALGFGKVYELTPLEWKGQMPKAITTRKVNTLYRLSLQSIGSDSDEADAIALGSRVLGVW